MISLILKITIFAYSLTGQYNTDFINEQDTMNFNTNYIDENTVYSQGYFMDANDFEIPENKQTKENYDALSEIKIWNEDTGEEYTYDSVDYDEDQITYYYKDMQITINYDVISEQGFSIIGTSKFLLEATYYNLRSIMVITIVIISLIVLSLYLLLKRINSFIKKITDIF